MTILRIIARLNVGGPARHVILLNAALAQRGHRTLLVHGALDAGEASLEHTAAERHVATLREPNLARRVQAGGDLRAFMALVRLMFREQPDVVHTHTAKAGTLGRLAALIYNATRSRRRRALVVHTFHGHVFEHYFSNLTNHVIRTIERLLARITDVIVTISPRQRHDIVERFRIASPEKTTVVPLGLDLERLLLLPRAAEMRQDGEGAAGEERPIVVGYVGRLVPVKDVPTLMKAFATARASVPQLHLVVAGDGPERGAVAALVDELKLGSTVTFAGWVDDLPRFYAGIDLLALSSLNEGTPVAVIEAMAAARAVVATAVGGVPDVVEAGVTGLLVPAGDVVALSGALVRLARDEASRRSMGLAGRARASERYSHLRLAGDIERLYDERLSAKRR